MLDQSFEEDLEDKICVWHKISELDEFKCLKLFPNKKCKKCYYNTSCPEYIPYIPGEAKE